MHRRRNTGSYFGSPNNFWSEDLIFDIVPFRSCYHALLGRTTFARFNAVPHYAYLKLKMTRPNGVITINGNTERSLRTRGANTSLCGRLPGSRGSSQMICLAGSTRFFIAHPHYHAISGTYSRESYIGIHAPQLPPHGSRLRT